MPAPTGLDFPGEFSPEMDTTEELFRVLVIQVRQ